ncbi:hypothetical protein AC249_AIPGENE3299 [Exaiptasia diaphana]|nr:hypothetical protein AC249_AIPGENE3299 [Exaiptasia diaphana]
MSTLSSFSWRLLPWELTRLLLIDLSFGVLFKAIKVACEKILAFPKNKYKLVLQYMKDKKISYKAEAFFNQLFTVAK